MTEIQLHSKPVYENCEKAVVQCYVQARSRELTMPPRAGGRHLPRRRV